MLTTARSRAVAVGVTALVVLGAGGATWAFRKDGGPSRVAAAAAGVPYVVYTIGLNPTIYGSVNQELLRRVANDPASAVYQSNYTPGQFYYVPSAGQLSQAFADIASDTLRIAK